MMQSTVRDSDDDLLIMLQRVAAAAMCERQDSRVSISPETARRSAAFKVYLSQQLCATEEYRYQRISRYQDILHRAKVAGVDPSFVLKRLYATETLYLRQRRCKTVINDYKLLSCLGKGGYGEVFLAKEKKSGRYVALKRMQKAVYTMKNFSGSNRVGRSESATALGRTDSKSSHFDDGFIGVDEGCSKEVPMSPRDTEIKLMEKKRKSQWEEVRKEREILSRSASQWIVSLYCCFQDDKYLYMAMEYAPGGDMRHMLDNLGSLDEQTSAFYFTEMCLAVDYLHSLGYVHRDLKPSNFVIDARGHIKLIDFGLSMDGVLRRHEESLRHSLSGSGIQGFSHKRTSLSGRPQQSLLVGSINSSSTYGSTGVSDTDSANRLMRRIEEKRVVGSPEYMCPEMLRGEGFGRPGDLWALGCILYEMIVGVTPFEAHTPEEVFDNILNWPQFMSEKPSYPAGLVEMDPTISPDSELMSDEAWNLIQSLICEKGRRLGEDSMLSIKRHPWFAKNTEYASWDELRRGPLDDIQTPFTPELDNQEDTSYFSSIGEETPKFQQSTLEDIEEEVESDSIIDGMYHHSAFDHNRILGFTFKAFPPLTITSPPPPHP